MTKLRILAVFSYMALISLAMCLFVLFVQIPLSVIGMWVWEDETFVEVVEKVHRNIPQINQNSHQNK
ncbi:hypothetical protein AHMF7605_27410 [Adhaeribacter arboris]|uniref:Uncharacterized protein n=1 Tax=Adhaeribacter arboris TaxID=2072846 RepID=A0A2T2YN89_9BACT|nr:hypothetical protein [Adhaeribacter arboris]PSR56956.1 hypothetical protein AHMF7605_27410 [Adhaeribacter arboris]